ncbi:MAG TPA: CGNR zinc finger domain-containing protein [Thermoplasmata archaeon]|nr:CGNR zinc finger domain-containing protein [Thermoplasmata archaeon]
MTPTKDREDSRWFAVDFANTTACPACQGSDVLVSEKDARAWARKRGLTDLGPIRSPELPALRRFRGDLVRLFGAVADGTSPSDDAIAAINRAAVRSSMVPQLRRSSRSWVVEQSRIGRGGSARVTARAARSAMELLAGTPPARIRRCLGPGCLHFLVAPTKSQRWCSPTGCGNRVRVQRHYRKVRDLRQRTAKRAQ